VPVVRDMQEKRLQKALLRWGDPKNRPLVEEALRKTGRLRPGGRTGPGGRRRRGGGHDPGGEPRPRGKRG
jgi:hypothetical protein